MDIQVEKRTQPFSERLHTLLLLKFLEVKCCLHVFKGEKFIFEESVAKYPCLNRECLPIEAQYGKVLLEAELSAYIFIPLSLQLAKTVTP